MLLLRRFALLFVGWKAASGMVGDEGGRIECVFLGVDGGDERSTGMGGSGMLGNGFCAGFTRDRLRKLIAVPNEAGAKSKKRFSVTGLINEDRALRVGDLRPAIGLSS